MTIYRDQLEAVYKLIEKPENWCKSTAARDADGFGCEPRSSRAASWCIAGALEKVGAQRGFYDSHDLDAERKAVLGVSETGTWNDTHTHTEVLALLKSAIERAPARP